jgi:16S rRNA (guanine1207-N2)-methyltransferase
MAPAERPQHYFDAAPRTPSRPTEVPLDLPDLRLALATDRGVFAADAVDPGTRYLLLDAPMPAPTEAPTVVDLGCGYGPIAVAVAARCPRARVVAVDVNERARALCAANAARAGLANVEVVAPDGVRDGLRVDRLYSNPPIRIGKAALYELLRTWLDRLTPDGWAVLVVHKHLGSDSLHRWLETAGYPTRRIGSRLGYRLLEVRPVPADVPVEVPR